MRFVDFDHYLTFESNTLLLSYPYFFFGGGAARQEGSSGVPYFCHSNKEKKNLATLHTTFTFADEYICLWPNRYLAIASLFPCLFGLVAARKEGSSGGPPTSALEAERKGEVQFCCI